MHALTAVVRYCSNNIKIPSIVAKFLIQLSVVTVAVIKTSKIWLYTYICINRLQTVYIAELYTAMANTRSISTVK